MAASTVLYRNAVLLYGGLELQAQLNELTLNYAAEMLDRTTFGDTTRNRRGGLLDVSLEMKGLLAFEAGSVDLMDVFDAVGADAQESVVLFADGITEGTPAGYWFVAEVERFNFGGAIGVLLPFDCRLVNAEAT